MQIVIDIPDNMQEMCRWHQDCICNLTSLEVDILAEAVRNGIVLPKGHGRLIDADAVNVNETIGGKNEFADCIREAVQTTLDNAPTVIGADKEAENDTGRA